MSESNSSPATTSTDGPQVVWTDVDSSHLDRVAYCEQTHRLAIEFKSGAYFAYDDVPMDVYYGLVGASSVGQYFDRVIKKTGLYAYERFMSREGAENKLLQNQ